jgi:two-component system sensor histidine kinase UhpB
MRWLDRRTREKEGKDVQTEGRVRAADGREVWIGQAYRCASVDGGRHRARGFLLDITRRKNHELQLEASQLLLRQHASRVEIAREEERIAVARELHDELGQALTLLSMELARMLTQVSGDAPRASNEAIAAYLSETKQMIAGMAETLRRILTSLRPPVLDEFGLPDAIEWQAKEFSRRAGLRCDVSVEPCEVSSAAVETAVFRIFQEVLTNIARHAHATHVKVSFRCVLDKLVLEVSDNGVGFDVFAAGAKRSFGLLGIRERAAYLGGEVKVVSSRGKGTKITTTMPTTQEEPQQ